MTLSYFIWRLKYQEFRLTFKEECRLKKILLLVLVLWFCSPAPAVHAHQFWADFQLRLEAEAGKLEAAYGYTDPDGDYVTNAWWFNGKQGVISRLIVLKDIFFLHPYETRTSVDQPWLHEFTPGFTHNFLGGRKIGEILVTKYYTWFESQMLWEYQINQYYQYHDGKSFFRLHQGQGWIFWVIDPRAEIETTL
jgi:hypothetical protein